MRFSSEPPSLSDREFLILRELIRERTGLHFDDSKREMLADRLAPCLQERHFEAFIDYYYLLKHGPHAEEEWGRVLDALSVPETYFWREFDQVRALVDVIVPEHFARRPTEPLRIWSAACATGEEPLTILMALAEAGWLGRVPIEIVASDGSAAALARARKGVYRERSFRNLSTTLRQKYFRPVDEGWQVLPELQTHIRWERVNLAAPFEMARCLPADCIFCRNVFIYFCGETVGKIVRRFAEGMSRPGYLFVGVSESLIRYSQEFELQEIGGAFVYVLK